MTIYVQRAKGDAEYHFCIIYLTCEQALGKVDVQIRKNSGGYQPHSCFRGIETYWIKLERDDGLVLDGE